MFKESGGRTAEWKELKKKVQDLIKKRCKMYQESQKEALLADDGERNFFKNTKNYMSKQRPKPFEVTEMYPGHTETDVAEILASHFNEISHEFSPLNLRTDLPRTYERKLPLLQPHEVAVRLKKFKKPKSMVRGDIFPDLVPRYADLLAVPLTSIYNEITTTSTWPKIWKEESVTVIPKCSNPTARC